MHMTSCYTYTHIEFEFFISNLTITLFFSTLLCASGTISSAHDAVGGLKKMVER
jgi:cell division protein FtsL